MLICRNIQWHENCSIKKGTWSSIFEWWSVALQPFILHNHWLYNNEAAHIYLCDCMQLIVLCIMCILDEEEKASVASSVKALTSTPKKKGKKSPKKPTKGLMVCNIVQGVSVWFLFQENVQTHRMVVVMLDFLQILRYNYDSLKCCVIETVKSFLANKHGN